MASSSSSLPMSSFSSQLWKYHVFLSFRGEDTRKTFVDHFYTALEQQGILTYKDDETLPRGESIAPSLKKAIKESQIAAVIFSKNYADSSWCLNELEYIMKCKEKRGQIVMPIFYDVDPSEVRKQKHKYEVAFVTHELENKTKVESWRKALVDASNISGWETKLIANGHESKCIKEIVYTISHRLHPITSSVDDNLVGIEVRMQDLISKLQIGFGGVLMIGVWGVGGGGKTTLASSIYDEVSCKFEGCCFINDVRVECNKNGLQNLQAEILSGVLKQKKVQVTRVQEGKRLIKDRLHHRKVLVVLDDVNHLDQLHALAGSHKWFGEGSRIIITTRDEHVLTGHRVDVIHNVSLLNNDEAMKLFCRHAPPSHSRIEDYEQLSKDVVSYARGLPLALKVLGCFLCDKKTNEWRSAMARLKEIPDDEILLKLKISFDGLSTVEKQLFLDIACFFRFNRKDDEKIMMKLEACGFHPVIGIKVLVQKALITTSDGCFNMHDLVEEMAHYIVRGEHPNNPEMHSRVWKWKDVLKIYAMDATTVMVKNLDKIEAINFPDLIEVDDVQHILQVAANMKNLRWLYLKPGNFVEYLPLVIMPENFPSTKLCFLKLIGLNATQLWEGYKFLPNLRIIELFYIKRLRKTPHFGGLQNLERFVVIGSTFLKEIHPSFGGLKELVYVQIEHCHDLEMLPPVRQSMKLEIFILSWCQSVFKHSNIQQSTENCVPQSMKHIGLWFTNICLSKLDLSNCNLVDEDIRSADLWELPNLQELNLEGNNFVRLNFSVLRLPRLKWLNVAKCRELVELSELPSSISVVIADLCNLLETFKDISKCKWLWKVSLFGRNKVGPVVGDRLLNLMLQGNAKDYFISISVFPDNNICRVPYVVRVNREKTYDMLLPHDWDNRFSWILMFVRYPRIDRRPVIIIIIKHGVENDFQCELAQEYSNETINDGDEEKYKRSDETVTDYDYTMKCIGYVSFSSLRRTGCFDSTYNIIAFSLYDDDSYGYKPEEGRWFRALLVPKGDHPMQTTNVKTDSSEFWAKEEAYEGKAFTIDHGPNSFIKIRWKPTCHY